MSLVYANKSGTLQAMGGFVNLRNIIQQEAPGGGGVASLQGVDGAITLTSKSDEVNFNVDAKTIDFSVNFPAVQPNVSSLNGLDGALLVGTPDNSTIQVNTVSPNITVGLNSNAFGVYIETVGDSATATIVSTVCVSTSVIQITYIHTGGGGGTQYIKGITAGTGSFTITCNTVIDVNDKIHWLILNA
jgi:hypothetical protein